ncbi:hypothetical protein [Corynebacterium diphtheriae]|uniref:hypothetical protein n=1 Tax=Corynebacterium diphtheriae TaxID=1717 RepID=UPI000893B6B6|nr:hypothetical protein BS112_08630 [Corynebacterium diphtheriae]MBG9245463.1 hypothetical protein [Corynebacterium diphtheriae bv. mitis]OWN06914.1 hypothetical protein AY499_09770 [Corynebacterium diphtheriae bv. gravis]OWN40750.1 hypothetical protein AY488_06775 [Corynebacterium belfantii]MBG9372149.1 hypothetical protein [Corynebacterium diphtheriae bv. mitis]
MSDLSAPETPHIASVPCPRAAAAARNLTALLHHGELLVQPHPTWQLTITPTAITEKIWHTH